MASFSLFAMLNEVKRRVVGQMAILDVRKAFNFARHDLIEKAVIVKLFRTSKNTV